MGLENRHQNTHFEKKQPFLNCQATLPCLASLSSPASVLLRQLCIKKAAAGAHSASSQPHPRGRWHGGQQGASKSPCPSFAQGFHPCELGHPLHCRNHAKKCSSGACPGTVGERASRSLNIASVLDWIKSLGNSPEMIRRLQRVGVRSIPGSPASASRGDAEQERVSKWPACSKAAPLTHSGC